MLQTTSTLAPHSPLALHHSLHLSTMAESAEDRKAKAAARQAKLQAKAQERLAKITGAAKGEGRVISDGEQPNTRGAGVVDFPSSMLTLLMTMQRQSGLQQELLPPLLYLLHSTQTTIPPRLISPFPILFLPSPPLVTTNNFHRSAYRAQKVLSLASEDPEQEEQRTRLRK